MSFTQNLIKHSFVYSLSGILFKASNFILLPIYTRVLTPNEIGTIALLGTFFGLFRTVTYLGSQTGILREYLYNAKTKKDKLVTISTGHWGLLFIVSALSLPPIYFAIPITEMLGIDKKYSILIALLFLNNFQRITKYARDTYFRINEYSKKSLFWDNCEHLLDLIISITLVVFLKMGVFGVIYGQIASLFFIVVMFSPWFYKTLRYGFDFLIFKNIFSYGLNFVFLNITGWIMNLSDRWIIGEYWDLSVLGLYSVGYRFSNFIQVLNNGFKNQWGTSLYKMGDKESVSELLVSSFMRYLALAGFIWAFLTLFLREILIIMTPDYYHSAYEFTPIIIFGYLFLGFGNIWSAGLHLQNKAKWFWILSSIGACTNIILNLIFIPKYGLFAAAITTFISFSIQPIGYIIITKKSYDINLPYNKIILSFVACFLIYICSNVLANSGINIYILIFIKSIIYTLFLYFNFYFQIINHDDFDKIKSKVFAFVGNN